MIIFIRDSEYYCEAINNILFTDRWIDRDCEYEDEVLLA